MSEGTRGTPARPRYLSIQGIRGLASVLIVLQHAAIFAGAEPALWQQPVVGHWIARPMHVRGFFFVLSGMVILMAHRKDIGHPASIPAYFWKRFLRIYPLYWLVLVPVVCEQVYLHRPEYAFQYDPRVIVGNFLLVHLGSTATGFDQTNLVVAWTLFLEIVFYAVFAVSLWSRRIGFGVFVLWMGLCATSRLFGKEMTYFCSSMNMLFGVGVLAAWLLHRKKVPAPGWVFAFGCVLSLGNIVYAGWTDRVGINNYLMAGVAGAFVLAGAAALETQGRLRIAAPLLALGEASYSTYLVHFPVVSVLARAAFRFDPTLRVPIWIWMALMVTAGTGAGLLLHRWIERPLLRWLRGLHLPGWKPVGTQAPVRGI